jgi:hypothetical protein
MFERQIILSLRQCLNGKAFWENVGPKGVGV